MLFKRFPTNIVFADVLRGLAVALCAMAMLVIGLTSKATANVEDKKTVVTFSAPVEIPGKALPAGTYVFKLADSQANRHIVQVFDKDEKQLISTILAIPDYRLTPTDKPLIKFEERASNAPEAIKAWYYPGDNYGVQFVYPLSSWRNGQNRTCFRCETR